MGEESTLGTEAGSLLIGAPVVVSNMRTGVVSTMKRIEKGGSHISALTGT